VINRPVWQGVFRIHGLPKVLPGPAMPDSSMPCGWPAHRAGSLGYPTTYVPEATCATTTLDPDSIYSASQTQSDTWTGGRLAGGRLPRIPHPLPPGRGQGDCPAGGRPPRIPHPLCPRRGQVGRPAGGRPPRTPPPGTDGDRLTGHRFHVALHSGKK
jgi:hypothetical protein